LATASDDRRRHFRVGGEWPLRVTGIEETGATAEFDATARNISLSGMLLEAAVQANLWAGKPLTLDLPGGVGRVSSMVRRFLDYGAEGPDSTRWGVEFVEMTPTQRALWTRFVFTAARIEREQNERELL
jgi:c-di-GMP-binding flagellar brake protein YcgR